MTDPDVRACGFAFEALRAQVAGDESRAALLGTKAVGIEPLVVGGFLCDMFADAVHRWAEAVGRDPSELFAETWHTPEASSG